jgi:uncharacterized protein (TIGR00369 family)
MDPQIEHKIRDSFARQSLMQAFGAEIQFLEQGHVHIKAPLTPQVLQQHGFGHAGLTFAIGDSAAGYAALTEYDPQAEVLTAEMKIKLLAPAVGHMLIAKERVIKTGRRLSVVAADVYAFQNNMETLSRMRRALMV